MVKKKINPEDLILGKKTDDCETEKRINPFDLTRIYAVKNLALMNNPTYITGDMLEGFIGCSNCKEREALEKGEKKVTVLENSKPKYDINLVEL